MQNLLQILLNIHVTLEQGGDQMDPHRFFQPKHFCFQKQSKWNFQYLQSNYEHIF